MLLNKKNIIFSFTIVALMAGCKNYGKLEEIGAPTWVFDSSSLAKNPNEVSAVGIGEASQGGLKVQLAQAETDARGGIANQILSEVARISKDAIRKTNIAGVDDVEKVYSQATQEVVRDLPLSGATRTNIWQDPKTDVLYVRMILDGKRVAMHLDDSMIIYEKRLKQSGLGSDSAKNNDLISNFTKGVNDRFKDNAIETSNASSTNSIKAPIAKIVK